MSVPTFVDVVDALRIMARRLTDLERLTRDHETRLDEIATTLYDPPLPPAAADSGPVLCPNCGYRMSWDNDNQRFVCPTISVDCGIWAIEFHSWITETTAAAIVRRMRGAR